MFLVSLVILLLIVLLVFVVWLFLLFLLLSVVSVVADILNNYCWLFFCVCFHFTVMVLTFIVAVLLLLVTILFLPCFGPRRFRLKVSGCLAGGPELVDDLQAVGDAVDLLVPREPKTAHLRKL